MTTRPGCIRSNSDIYYDLNYWRESIDKSLYEKAKKFMSSEYRKDILGMHLFDFYIPDHEDKFVNAKELHNLIAEKLIDYTPVAIEKHSDELDGYEFISLVKSYWRSYHLMYTILVSKSKLEEVPFEEGGEFIIKNKKLPICYNSYWD